jgi:hypothetical protein
MSENLKDRARFVVQLFRECDAIQLPHRPTKEVLLGMIERIETLEHTLDRVAAVLRLSLKYNSAMHAGAAAHNQHLLDTLAEIEKVRGASGEE